MQKRRERSQQQMLLLPPLDSFIPIDHRLHRLNRVLDLSFVHEAVHDLYCQDNGRPSIDPEVIIRLFLIQAMEGIPHVRELMRQVQVNLAYRWFIGYELCEKLPDHSTLSKALDRFGDKVFDELFSRSIAQCQSSGLVDGRVLHVDATTIRADLDANKVRSGHSPDPDARFGRFPDGTKQPGYKQQTVADSGSRVILAVDVWAANENEGKSIVPIVDNACERLLQRPQAVCADGGYSSAQTASELEDRGIRFVTPPPKVTTTRGGKYYSVEEFSYNEESDEFTCPGEKRLKYIYTEKKRGRRIYGARIPDCRSCPLKSQCTISESRQLKVTKYHPALVRLRADSRTESFKRLYRSRAPVIEGIFAEGKQWHCLGRAWRRGLRKMRVQCLLVSAVINLKRLIDVLDPLLSLIWCPRGFHRRIWDILGSLSERYTSPIAHQSSPTA